MVQIGKYANFDRAEKKPLEEKKEITNNIAKKIRENPQGMDIEQFAKDWNEACNNYKKGMAAWKKNFAKEWDKTREEVGQALENSKIKKY